MTGISDKPILLLGGADTTQDNKPKPSVYDHMVQADCVFSSLGQL